MLLVWHENLKDSMSLQTCMRTGSANRETGKAGRRNMSSIANSLVCTSRTFDSPSLPISICLHRHDDALGPPACHCPTAVLIPSKDLTTHLNNLCGQITNSMLLAIAYLSFHLADAREDIRVQWLKQFLQSWRKVGE
eukprot:752994-Hanusia_phi.AAC.2